jgi:hypothetical protein
VMGVGALWGCHTCRLGSKLGSENCVVNIIQMQK